MRILIFFDKFSKIGRTFALINGKFLLQRLGKTSVETCDLGRWQRLVILIVEGDHGVVTSYR